ncbi:Calcium/calmodulin-dependent protein kinase type 1 [Symbiodinium microadriaticum]|uniref:Calcium/calmodulin-dependent protein kinase type 1 n=1 Tax=Symbiodinium microadriaticum TaxID=2951 RepID=A0A1Q9C5V5_SYMMI|nr:Calcium/calmodulin-dependent protein kinase type 1 [Symbiodinium microadriaticum]
MALVLVRFSGSTAENFRARRLARFQRRLKGGGLRRFGHVAAVRGFVCLPPECQGVCSSYAQLATAAPAMLQSSKSAEVLRRRGSSPSLPRGESQDLSQVSITSLGQDSAARRAQELLLLLQAGDVWCLGCAVHVLLCGQIPVVDPAKMGEQELPHLTATSPGATEFCRALLHPQPRKRPSAEAALECPWFGQCEGIQKAHRSQAKHTLGSLTAPKSAQFFEKLRQTSAAENQGYQASMTCLRRLFHSVRAVRGASVGKEGLQIPGPEEDNKDTSTNARAAADAMCAEAFEWLLFTSGATSSGGLPLRKLMLKVDTLISSVQFAEMIWATCA